MAKKRKKKQFELLRGLHRIGDTVYSKGDVVETNEDLGRFKNKFRRVDGPRPKPVKLDKKSGKAKDQKLEPEEPDEEVEEEETAPKHDENGRGEDLTDKFPSAEEEGLLVFKRGKWYHVYDDEDASTPVNDKGLKSKAAVKKFIKAWLEE